MAYTFNAWDGHFKTREMIRNGRAFYHCARKGDALKDAVLWLAENPPQSDEGYAYLEKTSARHAPETLCKWEPTGGPVSFSGKRSSPTEWGLVQGEC